MPSANDERWVVAFAGARDSYQVPTALHDSGLLQMLVTDFYAPLDRHLFANVSKLLPSSIRAKLSRRFNRELPSRLVRSELGYAIPNWWHPEKWIRRVGPLGERAGQIAARERCSIFAYAHVATSAFAVRGVRMKVLMQMQPHPAAVKAALKSDELMPEFQDQIRNEATWPPEVFHKYSREPQLADACIVASSYTRKTLVENGVAPDRIFTIPYGVDLEFFSPVERQSEKFSVLFVGQLCRQKGLHYLLEAWRHLRPLNAELRIVGHPLKSEIAAEYASIACFLGPLDWMALREEYRRSDLLCQPSLSDGFGQVVLEALACGTPVLTTTSCGASDVIRDGEDGFTIPAADLDSLIASLDWASKNRDKLREMRSASRATAEQYPWTKFRTRIVESLRSLPSQSRQLQSFSP